MNEVRLDSSGSDGEVGHKARGDDGHGVSELLGAACRAALAAIGADVVRASWWPADANQRFVGSAQQPKVGLGWPTELIRAEKISGPMGLRVLVGAQAIETPCFLSNVEISRANLGLLSILRPAGVRSYGLLSLIGRRGGIGFVEVAFLKSFHRWRSDDVAKLEDVTKALIAAVDEEYGERTVNTADDSPAAQISADAGATQESHREIQVETTAVPPVSELSSREVSLPEVVSPIGGAEKTPDLPTQVCEVGRILVVRTNEHGIATAIHGPVSDVLGISSEEFLRSPNVWRKMLSREDYRRWHRHMRSGVAQKNLQDEVVVRRSDGSVRTLLVRARRLVLESDGQNGWEGIGIDISERRAVESALQVERRRIEALYEISRVLEVQLDPATVTFRALKALVRATNSDSALGCFYDAVTGNLEIVAAVGLSAAYLEGLAGALKGPTLIRLAIEGRTAILSADVQTDPRAMVEIAKLEGLRSATVVPLLDEQEVIGAIVTFCKQPNRYTEADVDLISAAARQIATGVRQSEFVANERRQIDALETLYNLSHELSKHRTASEVAYQAFPIIQREIPCKRQWLGIVNDAGTHIVGQAGVGPGVRKPIIEMQLSLIDRKDAMIEVLKRQEPTVLQASDLYGCAGLERLGGKFDLGSIVVVPLAAVGQVVGLMILEPTVAAVALQPTRLALLGTIANEIATVLMARRFESKMAEADKMRMAGLLASGVAHNFNNMLQAVMGQASLIEMQSPRESTVGSSARMIVEAASRGAALIKQLLSFSNQGTVVRRRLAISRMLQDSRDLYASVVGSGIQFDVRVEAGLPDVLADYNQVQQVVTNLLMNAREAIGTRTDGRVRLISRPVQVRAGEIDPELNPGRYVRVDVIDNGAGMDPQHVARCFEPFYTTKNVDVRTGVGFAGTGLGLSSAYSIIRQHDGVLTVRSQLGAGSTISVYLPARQNEDEAQRTESLPQNIGPREAIIFNLESNVELAVKSTVESLGLRTLVVNDRDSLVALFRDEDRIVPLVVLDLDRIEGEAQSIISALHELRPRLTILCSTVDRSRWHNELAGIEGLEIVEKPIGVWTLSFHVRRAIKATHPGLLRDRLEVEAQPAVVVQQLKNPSNAGVREGDGEQHDAAKDDPHAEDR